jgi:hypothetical protein
MNLGSLVVDECKEIGQQMNLKKLDNETIWGS